jgi:hypothetical protein
MRVVACAGLALLAGCGGGVEERLPPISLQGRLNLPSAAARAGVVDQSWRDADGEWFRVQTGERTLISVRKEVPFLSEAAVDTLRRAPKIELEVQKLDLGMAATVDARLLLDGIALAGGRVQFPVEAVCPFEHVEDLPNGVELDVLVQPVIVQ